jgi:hypothetical protein
MGRRKRRSVELIRTANRSADRALGLSSAGRDKGLPPLSPRPFLRAGRTDCTDKLRFSGTGMLEGLELTFDGGSPAANVVARDLPQVAVPTNFGFGASRG